MRCLITLTKNSNIIITYIAYDFLKKRSVPTFFGSSLVRENRAVTFGGLSRIIQRRDISGL